MVSAIIIKNKMDIDGSNSNRPSLRQTIYNQVDYVIRQFTNQGKKMDRTWSKLMKEFTREKMLYQ